MVRMPPTETPAAARRRLTSEMTKLGTSIDKQQPGSPKRLELLRRQASVSDELEALRSARS